MTIRARPFSARGNPWFPREPPPSLPAMSNPSLSAPGQARPRLKPRSGFQHVHSHPQPTVDEDDLACDEGGLVGAEKAYSRRHVFRIAETAERGVLQHRLPRVLRDDIGQAGLDVARGDDVVAHTAASELAGERLREANDPGLRGRVVRLAPVASQADDAGEVDDRARPPFHHPSVDRTAGVED